MASLPNIERDTYRLIATRRNASEVLLVPSGSNWLLPKVEILPRRRIAEQVVAEARTKWGFDGYCLFIPAISTSNGNAPCAVMESLHNSKAPAGTCWVPRDAASQQTGIKEERTAIAESLEELDSYVGRRESGPFASPGWLKELFRWVQEQIASLGLRVTGKFQQFNASPTFSLIRLETNGPAVWFKATGEPNRHELSVTVTLARLFPRYVPAVIGARESWNAWLSVEVPGTLLGAIGEISDWERAALELAELQILSIPKTAALLECQCKDLRLPKLMTLIDPFLARMTQLMAGQERQTPARLTNFELTFLTGQLKRAMELLREISLPDTVGHIDFNPGNILVSRNRCVFLDWAEGCVTNPLITFEYLREHLGRSQVKDTEAEQRISAAYLQPWHSLFSPSDLARARTASPLVAVFAYAVANDTWNSTDALSNLTVAGYLRSLTRRMYREATQTA
ncbi:MAG: phosphotransferase [Candidatus Acidiferrales bacterium]